MLMSNLFNMNLHVTNYSNIHILYADIYFGVSLHSLVLFNVCMLCKSALTYDRLLPMQQRHFLYTPYNVCR